MCRTRPYFSSLILMPIAKNVNVKYASNIILLTILMVAKLFYYDDDNDDAGRGGGGGGESAKLKVINPGVVAE